MPKPKDRFWCQKCKAYFCQNCVLPSSRCPNCDERLYEPESKTDSRLNKVLVIILGIVMIIPLAFILAIPADNTPHQVSPIPSASPGQTVRLYGTINATSGTAFVLDLGEDDWVLRTSQPFLLVDTRDPSVNITVDVSRCRDFYRSAHFITGDKNCSYLDGDNITVVGDVRTNASGGKVLHATKVMSWYSSYSGGSYLSYLMLLPFVLVVVMAIATFKSGKGKNRRYHADFLATHAGKPFPARKAETGPAPSVLQAQAGPSLTVDTLGEPFNVEWIPNRSYRKNRMYSIIASLAFIAIGAPVAVLWANGILAAPEGEFPFAPVFAAAFIGAGLVMLLLVPWMANTIPSHAGLTSKGLYFKHDKPTNWQRIQSAAWTEIADIPNADEMIANPKTDFSGLQFKVGDTTLFVFLEKELSIRIIEAWRRHRPSGELRKEQAGKRHEEELEALGKKVESERRVEWTVNRSLAAFERTQRNLLRIMAVVFSIPAAACVWVFISTGFDPLWLIMIIPVLFPGLLVYSLIRAAKSKSNKISGVGFSDQGMHFRFAEKDPREPGADFVPWSEIRDMAPPAGSVLTLRAAGREKALSWFNLDDALVLRAARELDRRRGCERAAPDGPASETAPNPLYRELWLRTYVPLALLGASVAAIPVTGFLFGILAFATVFLAAGLFVLVLLTVPMPYSLLCWAPEKVSFFASGVGFSFGQRPVPAGSAGYLAYDELERLSPPEDEPEGLSRWGPDQRPGMKSLIAVKKSGTRWFIGPFDLALIERIRKAGPGKP
jgi:hypothetical protein